MSAREEMGKLAFQPTEESSTEDVVEIVRLHRLRVTELDGRDKADYERLQKLYEEIRADLALFDDDLVALTALYANPKWGLSEDLGDALMLAMAALEAGFKR